MRLMTKASMRKRFQAALCAGLLLGGFGVGPASADDGDRKLTNSPRTVVATGAAWGNITSLADGSLGLICEQARPVSQVGGAPNVAMEWVRSTDGGQSWSQPITVAQRLGSGGQLFDLGDAGGYIVYDNATSRWARCRMAGSSAVWTTWISTMTARAMP